MIHDPQDRPVTCDRAGCYYEEDYSFSLSIGSILDLMGRTGWTIDGGFHLCPDCSEDGWEIDGGSILPADSRET
jgi:hypothetical protein